MLARLRHASGLHDREKDLQVAKFEAASDTVLDREDSLSRLLQRNQSGGFTSGTQLYDYLKAHKCVGLTAGRARVFDPRPIRLHLRSEGPQDKHISLRLDANRNAVEMNRGIMRSQHARRWLAALRSLTNRAFPHAMDQLRCTSDAARVLRSSCP
jgi:hypothetical protein